MTLLACACVVERAADALHCAWAVMAVKAVIFYFLLRARILPSISQDAGGVRVYERESIFSAFSAFSALNVRQVCGPQAADGQHGLGVDHLSLAQRLPINRSLWCRYGWAHNRKLQTDAGYCVGSCGP